MPSFKPQHPHKSQAWPHKLVRQALGEGGEGGEVERAEFQELSGQPAWRKQQASSTGRDPASRER